MLNKLSKHFSDYESASAGPATSRGGVSQKVDAERAEVHGNRTIAQNCGKTALSKLSGAECGALGDDSTRLDAGLRDIIHAWPTLPADVRAAVLALVEQGASR